MSAPSSQTQDFHQQVRARFGVLPNFFCSAKAAPGLMEELWGFAKSAYLDSPLPSLWKERLFVYLSRFCPVRYCIVRHAGFLMGLGHPAGDNEVRAQTLEQVIDLLSWSLPDAAALNEGLTRLEAQSQSVTIPDPDTPLERDLFEALAVLFIEPRQSGRARLAIRQALGETAFELLTAYLAFIRTAHFWTETHPELAYEPDIVTVMNEQPELSDLLLNPTEAEQVQQGDVLRQALAKMNTLQQTVHQSQQREAFLFELSDGLKPLVAPLAVQHLASRLLGEHLGVSQVHFGEIIGEEMVIYPGYGSELPPIGPIDVGEKVMATHRAGQLQVVVDVIQNTRNPEVHQQRLRAAPVRAYISVPLTRKGQLVATLAVYSRIPRSWTPQEVELVREVAERTWTAVERARNDVSVQELQHSNKSLQQFAAFASHDLQEPLRKIQAFGDILKTQYSEQLGDGVEHLNRMQAAAGRMSILIKDLLTYARVTSQKEGMTQVSLTKVVHQAVNDLDLVIAETGAQVYVGPMPTLSGNASQLGQLFQNLLSNALKFRTVGMIPTIQITARTITAVDLPLVVKPSQQVSAYHLLEVSDNGIGFEQEQLGHMFEVFHRLNGKNKYAGSGVGLAICETIVMNHGGAITALGQPNQGSIFSIYLPI